MQPLSHYATTVSLFREHLRLAGVYEELFQMFTRYLDQQGLKPRGGQIIDATLVPVPKQRNRPKEKGLTYLSAKP